MSLSILLADELISTNCEAYEVDEEYVSKFLPFTTYFPTLGTAHFPAQFPVFFVEHPPELPTASRFGFKVIYGTPDHFAINFPLLSETVTNVSFKPSGYYSSVPKNETEPVHPNEYPVESNESEHNPEEPNSSLTYNNDWSREDYGRSFDDEVNNFPVEQNRFKKYSKQIKPTSKSYTNKQNFPPSEAQFRKAKTYTMQKQFHSLPPKGGKSYSTQKFYKSSSNYNALPGKLHHREGYVVAHPQREIYSKNSKESFRPSPPDLYRNSQKTQGDYSTEYSHSIPTYSKLENLNITDEISAHGCVRTNKTIVDQKENLTKVMHCYVCTDEKSSSHYEECTFDEFPKLKSNVNYYDKVSLHKQSSKKQIREKREAETIISEDQSRMKRQNDYYEHNDRTYGPYDQNYRFGPEHFVDDDHIVDGGESSYESDDPNEKCWKKKKGDMLCIACENSENGGTYEQCSYASDPNHASYGHTVSNEYGSPITSKNNERRPYNEQVSDEPVLHTPQSPPHPSYPQPYQDAPHPISHPGRLPTPAPFLPPHEKGHHYAEVRNTPNEAYSRQEFTPSFPITTPIYTIPANTYVNNDPGYGVDFGEYRFNAMNDYGKPYNSFDESFSHVFPEIANNPAPLREYDDDDDDEYDDLSASLDDEEGQFTMYNNRKIRRNPVSGNLNKNNGKVDFKRTMNEFSNKNRTACKKIIKEKMTCYQCLDEKGVKHEDCLFVKPLPTKNSKISYHKFTEFNSTPSSDNRATKRLPDIRAVRYVNPRGRYTPPHMNKEKQNNYSQVRLYRPEKINDGVRYARSSDSADNVANIAVSKEQIISNITEMSSESGQKNITPENTSEAENDKSIEDNGEEENTEKEKKENKVNKKTKSTEKRKKKYNAIPSEPPELQEPIPNTDGKFSEDTELMFDPLLGISLPKYMLEKSEHEAIFDEVLASG